MTSTSDPYETRNLLDKRSARARSRAHEQERERLAQRLAELCVESATLMPRLPDMGAAGGSGASASQPAHAAEGAVRGA